MISTARRVAVAATVAGLLLTVSTCRLDDLVNAGRLGTLDVTPLTVRDSARVGSTAPRVMTATLAVAGANEAVPWTLAVIGASPWLQPAATGGTVPGTLSVSLDPSNLAEGTYRDTIAFSLSGTEIPPIKVPVEFTIQPCAVTNVTPPEARRDTITAADCAAPHRAGRFAKLYRFTATGGDSITVLMGSSVLDAFILVDTSLAPTALPLAENDACTTSAVDACLRYLYLPRPGNYFVEASTSPQGTAGDFLIQVSRPRPPLLPDTLLQSTNDVQNIGIAVGGAVGDSSIVLRASLSDPDGDSLRMEVEVRPVGTPFTDTPTATGPLFPGSFGTQVVVTGLSDDVAYHWQVRARDRTGRASAWRPFGGNAETAGDFRVAIPQAPAAPSGMAQLKTDGTTAITLGGLTDEATALFRATLNDADPGDQIRLEVEVRPVGTAFTDAPSGSSLPVATTGAATATVTGLADNVTYHWQARAVDQTGRASPWGSFGGNLETAPDFRVAIAPARLTVLTQPGASTAGQAIAPAVRVAAQDAQGNTLGSFTGAVTAAIGTNPAGAGGTLSGTTSVVAVQGIATFSALVLDRAASGYTLLLTAGGINATTAAFAIAPGPARQLAFAAAPTSATAGASLNPAVQVSARDSIGNVATAFTGNVTVALGANPGGGALGGTLTQQAVAGVATFGNLTIDRTGAGYTLTASATNLTGATSAPITVTSGAATQLAIVTQPSASASSGVALLQQPALDVRDAGGNVVAQAGVQVTATIATGPAGASLVSATATSDNAGRATFSGLAITGLVGSYTLQFAAQGLTPATSGTVVLGAGTAAKLALATPPSSGAQSGALFAQQPAIQLVDGAGNSVPQSGVDVTVGIASGGGTLGGTTTIVTNATGLATFTDLSITGASGPRTLTFTATNLTSVTSGPIAIGAGGATQIALHLGNNQSATAGSAVAIPPAVIVRDGSDNPVAGVDVTFAVTGGGGTVQPTAAIATDVNGVATVTSWTLGAAVGANELRATATGLSGSPVIFAATGTVGAAAALVKTSGDSLTGPVGTTLGTPHEVTVRDANGNPVQGVPVSFAAVLGGGSTNPTFTTTDVNGRATTVRTLGNGTGQQTTTASATLSGTPTTVTFTITATVGGASQMAEVGGGNQVDTVGQTLPAPLSVRVMDALSNPVQFVTVTWTVTDGGGSVNPTSIQTDANGLATTSWTLGTITTPTDSTQSVRATAAGTPVNFIATTRPDAVSAAQMQVIAPSPVVVSATANATVAVTARDQYGNVVPNLAVLLSASGSGNVIDQPTTTTNANGVTTGLFGSTVAGNHTITATVAGVAAAQQPVVTVTPGGAASLALLVQPSDVVAGAPIVPDVVVEARDGFANRATGAAGSVDLALNANPGGATLSGTTTRAFVAGLATFTGINLNRVGSGYTLQATATGLGGTLSNGFAVTPAGASQLVVTSQPPISSIAGAGFGLTVTARDPFGNTDLNFTGTIALALAGGTGGAVLSGTASLAATAGVATFGGLSVNLVGAGYTLNATTTAPGVTGTATTVFAITPAGATQLVVTTQPPASSIAGVGFGLTVTARDPFGNTDANFTGTINLALVGGPGALSGTASVGATAGVATFSGLSVNLVGTGYTLNVTTTTGGVTGTATTVFAITPAAATQLAVTAQPPASSIAGVGFGLTVTARDQFGNTDLNFTGTIDLALVGGPGALSGTASVGATAGVATFSGLSVNLVGATYQLNATTTTGGVTGTATNTFAITPAGATQLVVTTQPPASSIAGVGFGLTVTARDPFGNTDLNFTGTIALALAGGTGGATLSGTASLAATAGVATFGGLSVNLVGTGYTLNATTTAPGVTGTASNGFAITPAAATQLVVTSQPPASSVAGAGFGLTVTARDPFGNTDANFTGTIDLALVGGPGALSGTASVGATAGVATFSGLSVNLIGTTYQLNVTTTTGGVTGTATNAFAITAGAPTQLTIATQPSDTAQSGVLFARQPAVLVRDGSNNPVASVDVVADIASGAAGLGGTLTATTDATGVATFANLAITGAVGDRTLSFTAGALSATSTTVTITPGPVSPTNSTVVADSTTLTASSGTRTTTITVTARDGASNLISGAAVVFTSVGTSNVFSPDTLGTTGVNGVFTRTFRSTVAQAKTINATIDGTAVSTPATLTVTPDAVDAGQSSAIIGGSPITAGTGTSVTVAARDQFNNAITGVPVVLTSTGSNNSFTPNGGNTDGTGGFVTTFSSTTAEPKTISVTINGVAIPDVGLTVDPDTATTTISVVTVSDDDVSISGLETSTITLQPKDQFGNDVTTGGLTVTFSTSGGTSTGSISTVTENPNGTYTATFTPLTPGSALTIEATINGNPVTRAPKPTITVSL